MASAYPHSSRKGWSVQLCLCSGVRVVLWLGKVNKTGANYAARQLEQLNAASSANVPPPPDALRWALGTDKRIKAKLAEWGLIPLCNLTTHRISSWFTEYASSRTDVSEATRKKYRNASKHVLRTLADKDLRAVTKGDADRFARGLSGKESHKGKITKIVKQIFAAAVADRIIESNPFDHLVGSTQIDDSRASYIDLDTFAQVLAKIPTPECRLAFTLARHAGLRVPSEVYSLEWQHIDWDAQTMLIHSPQGKRYAHRATRLIPIFPSVAGTLADHFEAAPAGATYVATKYRKCAGALMRRQLIAAIERAGIEQWAKLWNNLRASCRTDLEAEFPVHVCDEWLGHSDAVARKHYKRVTPDHFAKALGRAVTRAVNSGQPG